MKAISQFVVHLCDLVEAEGRVLLTVGREEARRVKDAAADLALGAALLLVAVPLLVAGFSLLAAALMWWLESLVSRPLAACLTGLAVLSGGGAGILGFRLLTGRRRW